MREIKFRAWDIKHKKMIGNQDDYKPDYVISMDGKIMYLTDNAACGDPECCGAFEEYYLDAEDGMFEVMQYTGLKDKNGNEIYEGDIVRVGEFDDQVREGGSWLDSSVHKIEYGIAYQYPAFELEPELPHCDCNGLHYAHIELSIEVIGNIYEHPELLEQ